MKEHLSDSKCITILWWGTLLPGLRHDSLPHTSEELLTAFIWGSSGSPVAASSPSPLSVPSPLPPCLCWESGRFSKTVSQTSLLFQMKPLFFCFLVCSGDLQLCWCWQSLIETKGFFLQTKNRVRTLSFSQNAFSSKHFPLAPVITFKGVVWLPVAKVKPALMPFTSSFVSLLSLTRKSLMMSNSGLRDFYDFYYCSILLIQEIELR